MATPLERLVTNAEDLQKHHAHWTPLAGKDDLLRRGLRDGIENCHTAGARSQMIACWNLLSNLRARQKIALFFAGRRDAQRKSGPTDNGDTLETLRLHENACGLIATALAAAAYQMRLSTGSIGEVVRWWRQAAMHLGDTVPDREPTLPEAWPASIEDLAAILFKQQWDLTATRYWTAWWLRKTGGGEGKTQAIGVAATYGAIDDAKGFVADLALEATPGGENRVIEHPEGALLPLSNMWLQTLKTAAGKYGRALCWLIRCPDSVPWEQRVFFGNSHGGAAAWGFWHVGHGKIADDRVITLASLQAGPGWPDHMEALELGEVGGIAAKVKAIVDCRREDGTPRFDTIVVAARDNERDAKAVLGNNSEIRIKNLETDAAEAVA